ncbi:ParA family protein [Clostridium psychrophilum]|uniref:ParA family protein n=1 Tax=Clostridium psychrophilum TaxID=132926 RepID=UPI001C0E08A6|nr:ParA family protein [Clostridium psychrophilum]MBU3183173.1 ParA family protein [Clostridium psychrophilum]
MLYINTKGGVGKTTTSINLCGVIASQGHKVLLVDNDPTSGSTQILNIENEQGLTLYDLYRNSKITFDDCITKYNDYIDVITNVIGSANLEIELSHKRNTKETMLKSKFEKFENKTDYDYIIIDNAPSTGLISLNALAISDYYLMVIDNSPLAMQGLVLMEGMIAEMKDISLNDNLKLLGILRNNFDKTTLFSKKISQIVEKRFQQDLFKTIIYNSVKYVEAITVHKPINYYVKGGKYVDAYKDLYYEIISRIK